MYKLRLILTTYIKTLYSTLYLAMSKVNLCILFCRYISFISILNFWNRFKALIFFKNPLVIHDFFFIIKIVLYTTLRNIFLFMYNNEDSKSFFYGKIIAEAMSTGVG